MKTMSRLFTQHEAGMGARILSVMIFLMVTGCTGSSTGKPETVLAAASSSISSDVTVSDFCLPVPEEAAAREYLGIETGNAVFSLSQINASVVVIEVFNMYCPHCQKEAPQVNELFRQIESLPELRRAVKIIGIGMANTPFEINVFREKYGVPFPLFSDEESTISKDLGIQGTPTFIGIRLGKNAEHPRFFFKGGPFGDIAEMIQLLKNEAGLRTE